MTEQPTDPDAAVEVWARMLCAADVHVYGGEHPTWQQPGRLSGKLQDDYRKAARWLLPRLTVGRPAAAPSVSADRRDRYAEALRGVETGMDHTSILAAAETAITVANAEQAELRTENARIRHELKVMYGGAFDQPKDAPADRDLRDRIAEVRKIAKRLVAHAKGFQDMLDESDRDPWARLVRADIDELVTSLAVLPAPADRPAVLREAAAAIEGITFAPDPVRPTFVAACLAIHLRRMADEAQQATPSVADADDPTQLRWGLGDVLYGDDDTTTVLMSGPAGEPYWLELDPDRAAALRDSLTSPDEAQQAGEVR